MALHDHAYKNFFSHPQMVRDLLEGFVCESWLAELDYESLERVNASFIHDDLRARASDVVWRVRWGENWVYIYLLLEFQSTVEPYMALRILAYVALLYQDLLKAAQLSPDGRLPPVFPIVLYNGSARWTAEQRLLPLIQPGPHALREFLPSIRYLLIDEGEYRDLELPSLRNLVAALFRLENSRTHREVDEVIGTLLEWLKGPEQASLVRAFTVWIDRVILAKLPGEPMNRVNNLQEMRSMLADRIQEWGEEFKREGLLKGHEEGLAKGLAEGLAEGRAEGLAKGLHKGRLLGQLEGKLAAQLEGRREGEAQLLLRQLHKRFGELPPWVGARLQQAPSEQLECWGERLLEASALDEVFQSEITLDP